MSNRRPDDARQVEQLLQRMLDGRLSSAERRHLRSLISDNAELRQQYHEFCQLHALLLNLHEPAFAVAPGADPEPAFSGAGRISAEQQRQLGRQPARRKAAWLGLISVATAIGLLILLGGRNFENETTIEAPAGTSPAVAISTGESAPVVAQLVHSAGARLVLNGSGEISTDVGSSLRAGSYDLQHGILQIEYKKGARLLVHAPASFQLIDEQTVELRDGRAVAHVPPSAIGFTISTPSADVVDFGTEFGVDVRPGKNSEVHVFDGEVEVKPLASMPVGGSALRLFTGQASRVDQATGVPAGIDLASQRFLRTIEEPASPYSQRVLELNPAVYYRMDPTPDGLTLRDSSDNGAHGQIEAGSTFEEIWATGKVGTALQLGGPALQRYGVAQSYPQSESDCISVVAWVYASSRPRWASIAKNWSGDGPSKRGQLHFGLFHTSGVLEAHIVDDSRSEIFVKDQVPLPLHHWQHVAFVADGEQLRLYRNGSEVASAPYHGLNRNPRLKSLAVGTKLNPSEDAPMGSDMSFWDGRLDELSIFNHALTAAQIRELFELGE